MLIHRADLAEDIVNAGQFGINADISTIDFTAFVEEVNDEVREESDAIEHGIKRSSQHTLYQTKGQFIDDRTLTVDDETISGEKVLIAAGSRPSIPPLDGLKDVDYLTSTSALQLEYQPDHLVIVGGGYIAAELGHFYGALGTDVTIIGRRERLLPTIDTDLRTTFTTLFEEKYDIYAGYEATAVRKRNNEITVEGVSSDGDSIEVTGDELLLAAGRQPNTDRLAVENTGVGTDEDGYIETNEYLETTADNVWALGDIVGRYLFKHTANHEARYATHNILGEADHKHPVDYTAVPQAIFTAPRIASVGHTEQAVREEDREYVIRLYEYQDVARGSALKEDDGYVKVIADPETAEIIGCHIIGPEAPTLIHEVCIAMTAGSGTVEDIQNTIHIHPAMNEVVHRAFSGRFSPPDAYEHAEDPDQPPEHDQEPDHGYGDEYA